jgi:hypothetical protein
MNSTTLPCMNYLMHHAALITDLLITESHDIALLLQSNLHVNFHAMLLPNSTYEGSIDLQTHETTSLTCDYQAHAISHGSEYDINETIGASHATASSLDQNR